MPRRGNVPKREVLPDPIYGSTVVYEENTVTTLDLDGNRSVETLRPDGLVEKMENYDPDGNLLSRMEYTYQEIQIPAKEE